MKIFSIITPTFNSEIVLRKYFDSIFNQAYDLSKLEILIIDGGSTDGTLGIVDEYKNKQKVDIRLMVNKSRLGEFAKATGMNESNGLFCVFQDSDEVLANRNSFKIREEIFNKHPEVYTLTLSKLTNPPEFSRWGEYYNCIGDPFSSFVYGPSFGYLEKLGSVYRKEDFGDYIICKVSKNDIIPLIDGVQTFRKGKLFEILGKNKIEVIDVSSIATELIRSSGYFAVTKKDEVLHYSSSSFIKIIRKINSRVVRNVYINSFSGFASRVNSMPLWYKYKKYLFLPYAILVFPALFDSIRFYIKTRNISFLIHPVFAFYTACSISWNMFLKLFGARKKVEIYG